MARCWKRANLTGIVCSVIMSAAVLPAAVASVEHSSQPSGKASEAQPEEGAEAAVKVKNTFSGNVSWYGPGLYGHKTASGEPLSIDKSTAAHRRLPFFTKVLVEDPKSGRSCIVKVNDRGPYVKTRVMDISHEAARRVGNLGHGVIYADCLVLEE